LQALVLRVPDLVETLNAYYAAVHFPLTFGVLAWLFLRHREHYSWARRSLLLATAIGLVLQLALPVAPPRMRGDLGFVDTAVAYGMSVYGGTDGHSLSNQYAAMPSLHVGWALLVAVVCIRALRSRWRWLWVLHPAVTVLVVVATGNHWWLDSLFGLALVSTSLVVCLPRRSAPLPAAGPAPAGERLPSAA
ncbi:MAG: phosphatase PAP2 family protein, partial [Mycobacteriales bacterium]